MSELPPPTTAPAGWYADPHTGGMRYFDGRRWVDPPPVMPAPAVVAERVDHPTLPIGAALGALVVLTLSLLVAKSVLDGLVGNEWPLVVYIVLATLISYGPSIGWGFYVRRRWGGGGFGPLGWQFRWSDLGWGPLTWLVSVLSEAVLAVVILATGIPFTSNLDAPESGSADRTYVVALLVAAVIAAPVVEEFVFRGLLMRGFLSRMHPVVAVGAQAVLFGAAHYDPSRGAGNIGLVMVLSGVGVVLGSAAFLARRLGPTVVAHAIINAVALTLVLTGALDGVDNPFEWLL